MDLVLNRTSDELRKMQEGIIRLQDAVGAMMQAGVHLHEADMNDLQYLDHLSQEIAAVADFLGSISSHITDNIMVDTHKTTSSVTLARMVTRLRGIEVAIMEHQMHVQDDIELF
jgi:uncharacterized protein with von Willebrand factor type A (vWA) domain